MSCPKIININTNNKDDDDEVKIVTQEQETTTIYFKIKDNDKGGLWVHHAERRHYDDKGGCDLFEMN